jgi:hypothetical protein
MPESSGRLFSIDLAQLLEIGATGKRVSLTAENYDSRPFGSELLHVPGNGAPHVQRDGVVDVWTIKNDVAGFFL